MESFTIEAESFVTWINSLVDIYGSDYKYPSWSNMDVKLTGVLPDDFFGLCNEQLCAIGKFNSIALPTTLTEIPDNFLYKLEFNNFNLPYNLLIPDTVTRIGKNAFREIESDLTIEIPDSVIEIDDYAFYESRINLKIGKGLKQIDIKALKSTYGNNIDISKCNLYEIREAGVDFFYSYIPKSCKQIELGLDFDCLKTNDINNWLRNEVQLIFQKYFSHVSTEDFLLFSNFIS